MLTGSDAPKYGADVPHDPGDFGRCSRLLEHFPEWVGRLPEVAEQYPEWSALVREWGALERMYKAKDDGLYDRMQELIEEGRISAGWTKSGPGLWRGPKLDELEIAPGVTMSFER
nr:hypothetical protein [Sedimenticola selenatireducens]